MTAPPHATARHDLAVWLGLSTAALLLVGIGTPPIDIVAALLLVTATLFLCLRWQLEMLAVLVLFVVGVWLRLDAVFGGYSDVLTVTQSAISAALNGLDPYGVGYLTSMPPGAPFAYGPLAMLWYLPSQTEPGRLELLVSLGFVAMLAMRGRVLGLAIYAVLPALLVTSADGSNDTSAGLFLLVALLVAERLPRAGGLLLALAAAFKPYALAWLPPLLAYGGIAGPLLAFMVGSVIAWGPAMVLWGPGPIYESLRQAERLHAQPYYSLAWAVGGTRWLSESAWGLLRFTSGAAVAVIGWRMVRSARSFVVVGVAIFLVTMFTGWWSTFAYLAAIAPIICWHLDDWLGLGRQRVVWPGDPVGQLSDWVDTRWPILKPWPLEPTEPSTGAAVSSAA